MSLCNGGSWPKNDLVFAMQPGMKKGDVVGHEFMGIFFYICVAWLEQ